MRKSPAVPATEGRPGSSGPVTIAAIRPGEPLKARRGLAVAGAAVAAAAGIGRRDRRDITLTPVGMADRTVPGVPEGQALILAVARVGPAVPVELVAPAVPASIRAVVPGVPGVREGAEDPASRRRPTLRSI
ncbi:MAG: hypothetical protein HYZ53_04310 [Planctomycetes bacterium]|nr:hypothetical protein [Planctomycetota bacterium]